jgi:hypothetical protein
LEVETQKRIFDTVSQVFIEVGKALGNESANYGDGIRFLQTHGDMTLFQLLFEILKRIAPEISLAQTLTPEMVPVFLGNMNTREKAELALSHFPEPDPQKLAAILREVSLFLPSIRRVLLPVAKALPPPPGGAPKRISESEEPQVRADVAQLFNAGYSVPDAKAIVARRRNVSLSTVQRICRKGTIHKET